VPLCKAPTLRRGQRPHHAQKEQNGTWEISRLTGRPSGCPACVGLEAVIEPGGRVAIEGDNQKQADFLASTMANVDPARTHDLHMVLSVLALPDHLTVLSTFPATGSISSYQARSLI
jgi:hypothetical protein